MSLKYALACSIALLAAAHSSPARACGLDSTQVVSTGSDVDVSSLLGLDSSCDGQKLDRVSFTATGQGLVTIQVNGKDANVGSIVDTDKPYTFNVYPFNVGIVFGQDIETVGLKVSGDVLITEVSALEAK